MEKGISKNQNRTVIWFWFCHFSFLDSEPKTGERLFFYRFFVFGLKRQTKNRWFLVILFCVSNEKTNYQNVHGPKWNADEERKLTSEKMDQKYSVSGDRLMFAKSNALKREKVPPLNNLTLTNKKLTNHIQDCDEMNYWLFIKGTSPLTSHSNFLFHQHSTGNCS